MAPRRGIKSKLMKGECCSQTTQGPRIAPGPSFIHQTLAFSYQAAGWDTWGFLGLRAIAAPSLYAIIGTILVPRLWADPLGPMLKIWPIIVAHFVALAILDDR
jgi:hypothetical protein